MAAPAWADSTTAFCSLSRHDHPIPVESGRCQFSQRQSYQHDSHAKGIRFTRQWEYTLSVLWQ